MRGFLIHTALERIYNMALPNMGIGGTWQHLAIDRAKYSVAAAEEDSIHD